MNLDTALWKCKEAFCKETFWLIPFAPQCLERGLLHTISWIQDLQLTKVDFELDVNKVVDEWKGRNKDITGDYMTS